MKSWVLNFHIRRHKNVIRELEKRLLFELLWYYNIIFLFIIIYRYMIAHKLITAIVNLDIDIVDVVAVYISF
jgi:hypothetical protein